MKYLNFLVLEDSDLKIHGISNKFAHFWIPSMRGSQNDIFLRKLFRSILVFSTPEKLRKQKNCNQLADTKNSFFNFTVKILNKLKKVLAFKENGENPEWKKTFGFSCLGKIIHLREKAHFSKNLHFCRKKLFFLLIRGKNNLINI